MDTPPSAQRPTESPRLSRSQGHRMEFCYREAPHSMTLMDELEERKEELEDDSVTRHVVSESLRGNESFYADASSIDEQDGVWTHTGGEQRDGEDYSSTGRLIFTPRSSENLRWRYHDPSTVHRMEVDDLNTSMEDLHRSTLFGNSTEEEGGGGMEGDQEDQGDLSEEDLLPSDEDTIVNPNHFDRSLLGVDGEDDDGDNLYDEEDSNHHPATISLINNSFHREMELWQSHHQSVEDHDDVATTRVPSHRRDSMSSQRRQSNSFLDRKRVANEEQMSQWNEQFAMQNYELLLTKQVHAAFDMLRTISDASTRLPQGEESLDLRPLVEPIAQIELANTINLRMLTTELENTAWMF